MADSYSSVLSFTSLIVLSLISCHSSQGVTLLKVLDGDRVFYACGVDWTNANTAVACRSLGYTSGSFQVVRGDFPRNESFSPYTWDCVGWEERLAQCQKRIRNSSCGNAFVAITCTGSGVNPSLTPNLRQISLKQSDLDASSYYGIVLTTTHNDMEWLICSRQDTPDQELVKVLTVACRQLGYASLGTFQKLTSNEVSPYLDEAEVKPCLQKTWTCFGNESRLSECDSETLATSRILYVECSYSAPPREGLVRLIGNHPYRGRVELYHNSLWGQLCPYHHLRNLQSAVCRQLHLGPFVETYQRTDHRMFGRIHDIVLLCEENTTDLEQCRQQAILPLCPSEYTLYVTCLPPTETLSIRLHSTSPNQTAVQVLFMDTWSFIEWDRQWTLADSIVVCRMLNEGPPEYFQATEFYVPGPHLRFHPSCLGTEESLLQCTLKIDYIGRGALNDVVAIRCAPSPQHSSEDNPAITCRFGECAPHHYYVPTLVLLAIVLCACICRKLCQARNTTNQIVRASLWEAVPPATRQSRTVADRRSPPSYNAFIKNPEIYPCVQDSASSIADEDLPPYPGLLQRSDSLEEKSAETSQPTGANQVYLMVERI